MYIYIMTSLVLLTSWRPVLRYGESIFTKENKALNFSFLLHYYVNSGQLLNCVYMDICPRRRLHQMCAFKNGKNFLSHERYSFKYTPSDKTNGL